MDDRLKALLDELYREGVKHDAGEADRLRRFRNLEPDSAALLGLLARAAEVRRAMEIGTANGYSTLWLADAVRDTGGRLVSVDVDPQDDAAANVERAGLRAHVDLRRCDGGATLAGASDEGLDLLFLDAERVEYPSWWPHPVRVLRRGGVLAIDNVLSHPDEVAPFLALVHADQRILGYTVPIGKGLYLGWRKS